MKNPNALDPPKAGSMPKGKMKEMERAGDASRSGPKQQEAAKLPSPGHKSGQPGGRSTAKASSGGSSKSSSGGDKHVGGSHLKGAMSRLAKDGRHGS